MRVRLSTIAAFVAAAALVSGAREARAQGYEQHNIVSNGPIPAEQPPDGDLLNAWGLSAGPTTPWWVADNGADKSTIYSGVTGVKAGLVVTVPGAPTGLVFNTTSSFLLNGSKALFIFATERGTVLAWNPSVGTTAFLAKDNSTHGALYKGAAIASTRHGDFLYLTNFRAGRVDVYKGDWTRVAMPFRDPFIPKGYAPFGIQNINNIIFVTYALQDEDKEDDVPGRGHGFVDAFDVFGRFLARVATRGVLDSPWGLALAPADFGRFSRHLLIGNFGDGRINAFRVDTRHATFTGTLRTCEGDKLTIDGLWALQFGNDGPSGPHSTLFFTAGPEDEAQGLFGRLTAATCPRDQPGHSNGR